VIGPSGVDEALDAWEADYAARLKAARDEQCALGQHGYVRTGDDWACRHCATPAPLRPGVREAS
jgi:hypothetical protein